MSLARWLAVVCCSSFTAASPAGELLDAVRSLEGAWTGRLEYRDYQTDIWTTIPTSLSCEASAAGPYLSRKFAFQDPGRTVISQDVMLVDEAAGRLFGIRVEDGRLVTEDYEVTERTIEGTSAWTIVFERDGEDAGRPARLRMTQKLAGGVLTSRQEVRYTADVDGTWLERNRTRFTRPELDPAVLEGTWRVDLRPTPDAAPYLQTLRIDGTQDGLRGSFYDTPIRDGRINDDWGVIHFAFTTSDGSGVYHTTGVLENGRLHGTTHSLGRGFLNVWTATRD